MHNRPDPHDRFYDAQEAHESQRDLEALVSELITPMEEEGVVNGLATMAAKMNDEDKGAAAELLWQISAQVHDVLEEYRRALQARAATVDNLRAALDRQEAEVERLEDGLKLIRDSEPILLDDAKPGKEAEVLRLWADAVLSRKIVVSEAAEDGQS